MIKFLKKIAGILDKPRDTMAVDVWTSDKKIVPQVKEQLLKKLYSFVPKNVVKEVFIIGSITGYKYKETSDIDINVSIDPYDDKYQKARKEINGFLSVGGRHPVNFYMVPFSGVSTAWQDAKFGVYDLLQDEWVVSPPTREEVRDPKHQFVFEIQVAQHLANIFDRHVKEFHNDVMTLKRYKENLTEGWMKNWYIKKKEAEVMEGLEELKDFAQKLEDDRQFVYSKGWGVPRTSYRNIMYKYIEHGPYGKFFEELKSLNKNEREQKEKEV
tara:strand:- start:241 stop:1050 length:810 start_codon:yes stop_codon:yes gene_type:complete